MGYSEPVRGHVDNIARAINVATAKPNGQGVATVNPIFTWVRLAQPVPVRIHIDDVPSGVRLVAEEYFQLFWLPSARDGMDQPLEARPLRSSV